MNFIAKLRSFSQHRLPLILGLYLIIQPLLDALTTPGALAEAPITAGVIFRTLFMGLSFLYVVFVSQFKGKKLCLTALGILLAYLVLFMGYMFSLGGFSLCVENVKELIKVFFAPFVMVFLYAVWKQYGYQASIRSIAWTGGLYAGVILLAFLTGTSQVSYGSSGYGFKGWFYAANEVSCVIALIAPVTIYYCLRQIPTITRKTWWKGLLIALALISIAFSANFIGTKIVFGITALYCLLAFVWQLVRAIREPSRANAIGAVLLGALCVIIVVMFFSSPLQGYLDNVYLDMLDEDSELLAVSWGEEIQKASEGTWLRQLIHDSDFVQLMDQLLSRRLFSSSPSVQVFTEASLAGKLLGIGYADVASYGRSIEFMIEMDPLAILVRQGIVGFLLYYLPYLAALAYSVVQFFRHPIKRMASLRYCTFLYASLAAFAISTIAGHALVSPGVSIFVLVLLLRLLVTTREQNQAFRTA